MFCCQHQYMAYGETYARDRRLLRFADYSAVLLSFLLVICRLAASCSSRSLAVDAAVADALKDWIVSTLNAFLVMKSLRPADVSFPFGYGKIEAIAAFSQAVLLLMTGGWIAFSAIRSAAAHDHSVVYTTTALISLIVSVVLGLILSLIQTYAAKRTKSMAFLADAAHYRSDVFMNIGIVCCFLISLKIAYIDVIVGLAMSVYLLVTAWVVGKSSLRALLDMSLPTKVVDDLRNLVLACGEEVASLRTHGTGRGEMIVLQIVVTSRTTVTKLLERQEILEQKIHERFPRSFVLVSFTRSHVDHDENGREGR